MADCVTSVCEDKGWFEGEKKTLLLSTSLALGVVFVCTCVWTIIKYDDDDIEYIFPRGCKKVFFFFERGKQNDYIRCGSNPFLAVYLRINALSLSYSQNPFTFTHSSPPPLFPVRVPRPVSLRVANTYSQVPRAGLRLLLFPKRRSFGVYILRT